MAAFENVLALVEKAVKTGLQEYEVSPERFEKQPDETLTGSKATIAEYGRPFWVCQPHVRPLPEEALVNGALTAKGKNTVPKDNAEKKEKETTGTETVTAEGASSAKTVDATNGDAKNGDTTSGDATPGDFVTGTATTPDNLVSG
jgi:tRNA-dihydrouridine synthase 1